MSDKQLPMDVMEKVLLLSLSPDDILHAQSPLSMLLRSNKCCASLRNMAFQYLRSVQPKSLLRAQNWIITFPASTPLPAAYIESMFFIRGSLPTCPLVNPPPLSSPPLVTHIALSASFACFRLSSGAIFVFNPLTLRILRRLPRFIRRFESPISDIDSTFFNNDQGDPHPTETGLCLSCTSSMKVESAFDRDPLYFLHSHVDAVIKGRFPTNKGLDSALPITPFSDNDNISVLSMFSTFYGHPLRPPHFKVLVVRLNADKSEAVETLEYDSLNKDEAWQVTGKPPRELTRATKGVCCNAAIYFLTQDAEHNPPKMNVYNMKEKTWCIFAAPLPAPQFFFSSNLFGPRPSLFRQQGQCEQFTFTSLVECEEELYFVGAFQKETFDCFRAIGSYFSEPKEIQGLLNGQKGIKVWKFKRNSHPNSTNTDSWMLIWQSNSPLLTASQVQAHSIARNFVDGTHVESHHTILDLFKRCSNGHVDCTSIGKLIYFVDSSLPEKLFRFNVTTRFWTIVPTRMSRPLQREDPHSPFRSSLPFQCFSFTPIFWGE